jgi:hypothetical protein
MKCIAAVPYADKEGYRGVIYETDEFESGYGFMEPNGKTIEVFKVDQTEVQCPEQHCPYFDGFEWYCIPC